MVSEDVLKSIIQRALGEKAEQVKIQNEKSTAPGENYGSSLVFITAKVKDKNQTERDLSLIVKSLPPSEYLRECFNVKICFPKEAKFYEKVAPEYIKLQKECGYSDEECFNSFPQYIGAHFSSNGEVTEDTALVLEDLTPSGFKVGSRFEGLDLAHSKLVMKEIAVFHALGIALKKKKPEVFDTLIRKDAGRCLKTGQDKEEILKNELDPFSDQVLEFLKTVPECAPFVPRLRRVLRKYFIYEDMLDTHVPREPFCTLAHNDLWVNNIMFNYDESGDPKSVKLLDFQRTKVGSPLCDLLLFLYTSTTLDVMKTNFLELLKLYHDNFFSSLERLGAASEDLDWENFQKELSDHAPENIFMSVCLLRVVMGKTDTEQSEMTGGDFDNFGGSQELRLRHIEVVRDLAIKGWI